MKSLTLAKIFHLSEPQVSLYKMGIGLSASRETFKKQSSSNEMDETGAYYTEWSKPERKTPIQYTNAYIWNLERW